MIFLVCFTPHEACGCLFISRQAERPRNAPHTNLVWGAFKHMKPKMKAIALDTIFYLHTNQHIFRTILPTPDECSNSQIDPSRAGLT